MCGGNSWPFLAKLITYNKCSGAKWSSYDDKWTYNRCVLCGGKLCPFHAKLATYDRCVVYLFMHTPEFIPNQHNYAINYLKLCTPVDGKSDRTVESDTNINCTRFLFKSLNTYVNTFVLLVFYIAVACLYFFSILKFNKNISDTIYFGVRLHCPVRFNIHGCI